MSKVGIVANPASGRDIRRLVAQAWVVSNQEKSALTARLLRGLEAAGVEQVLYMPEPAGICPKACRKMGSTRLRVCPVEMPVTGDPQDSTRAAAAMVEAGVACIVTLGGDGTNRAVFKGSGSEVPLLPISTGTNNVFSEFQEGTTAGLAAGLLATGRTDRNVACTQSKVLWLHDPSGIVDLALIDLAVTTRTFIGARAIWEVDHLKELYLTRAQPWSIGLSAIGGFVETVTAESPRGLHLVFGPGGRRVTAPLGPGLFREISISAVHRLSLGEKKPLELGEPVTLAFDGERDRLAGAADGLEIQLSSEGPWVVDTVRAVTAGLRSGGLSETTEKRQKKKSDPRRATKNDEGPLRR